MSQEMAVVEVDVLVIGTGPAGSACALSLARNGIKAMVINQYGWTARTPRAHITNPRTMEVLHDLGVYEEALRHAVPHELMGENTFCTSLAGPEIGRIRTWGMEPARAHNYAIASPETNHDITQNLMEPVLLGNAAHDGAQVHFNTKFLGCKEDADGVTSTLLHKPTDTKFKVRSKYLVGADGANSMTADIAGLPLAGQHAKEGSMNIVFDADLSKFVAHRPTVLFWVIQDGSDVGGLGMGVVRMVRPWNRWLAIWGYDLEAGQPDVDEEKAIEVVHKLIGDDTVSVDIDSISFWTVNEVYAEKLSKGRIFCMGDAVHRHPPTKGLGSNTSIQDAFNLAWKLAYVLKGKASPELLDSYSQERAPIAKQVVTGANRCIQTFFPIIETLGVADAKSPEEAKSNMMRILDPNEEGGERRDQLIKAVQGTRDVFDNPGIEIDHRYKSVAVAEDGTRDPGYEGDPEVFFEPTTYPGARLPHAWVVDKTGNRVSTLYLCGKTRFTILTGIAGQGWIDAAKAVGRTLDVDIDVKIIGPLQNYQDLYGEWLNQREVSDGGCVLVRPDHHVGWRSMDWSENAGADLESAMREILART